MRILVVSQYFWPENFRINDLCLALKDNGHELTVVTGKPNYPWGEFFDDYVNSPRSFDFYHDIPVVRVPMLPRKSGGKNLLLNYISFIFSGSIYGAYKLRKQDFDIILVCQLSPVTAAIPAIVLKKLKGIPLVMWSLDLWPESLEAVGVVKSKRVLSVVGKLVSWIYGHCDVILGQSESYLDAVRRRSGKAQLELFPNWAEDQFKIEAKKVDQPSSVITIMFAGNVGDAQDFESIIECAKLLKESRSRVQFSIVGSGRKLIWLKSQIEDFQLDEYFILHGQHALEHMPVFYEEADIALVSLKPNDIFERTIPGKIQSYMLASLPILSMLDGEGKKLVEIADCGLACSASGHQQLYENILSMMSMSQERRRKLGANGKAFAEIHFNKARLVAKLETLLETQIERVKI
ncbi:glycosyltransferase WbuB [Shewanella hanedai]|uniref:Glycosyltransferase family 4 protein n=1 Tax=Shewanella hanedai TaxID=25 RepID=A0A553JTA3_SHEHA|nr:glycosyltransferase family 4 protein [Shewanella hanedai]TRY15695.1 glycosyltransferase family 4 protein [Shewanella hanedai]GGI71294.1 glycosyltransferase WbuB [Shewanella hanedai]